MKHYLSPTGMLWAYEPDGSQDHLIPDDFTPATAEQVQAIQNPTAAPLSAADKLAALDGSNTLTQRNLRETVMLMAEAFKTLSGGQLDLSTIPGVAKVYEVEAQAAALRGEL